MKSNHQRVLLDTLRDRFALQTQIPQAIFIVLESSLGMEKSMLQVYIKNTVAGANGQKRKVLTAQKVS